LLLVVAAGPGVVGCEASAPSWRMIVADPALCGGCRRCAITCSSLRFDAPGPARALVDSDRIYQREVFRGPYWHAATCHMCPEIYVDGAMTEPTCVAVCPTGAAQIAPTGHPLYGDSRIRVIEVDHCIGCGRCVRSCPYEHPLLVDGRSRKCDLCLGRFDEPPCVEACPATALRLIDYYATEPPRPFPWEQSA
jgi:anaerobic dimethyl sulfoxide reductase subunit B (iron-sulfur subunit)